MSRSKEETALKFKYWSQVIHDCKNSGMMTRDWLVQNGISRDAYYYWFNRLKKSAVDSVIKEAPATTVLHCTPSFVEVPLIQHKDKREASFSHEVTNTVSATISLQGMTVSISDNASSDFLLKLLGALSHVE